MHKAQRGLKLSVVRKVVTPLNFVTPPSFSVTPRAVSPSEVKRGQKGSDHVELCDHAEFFRDHAELWAHTEPPGPSVTLRILTGTQPPQSVGIPIGQQHY